MELKRFLEVAIAGGRLYDTVNQRWFKFEKPDITFGTGQLVFQVLDDAGSYNSCAAKHHDSFEERVPVKRGNYLDALRHVQDGKRSTFGSCELVFGLGHALFSLGDDLFDVDVDAELSDEWELHE